MKYYTHSKDALKLMKWLRANGERGTDWEASGGARNLTVYFKNDKLELAYTMVWEWGDGRGAEDDRPSVHKVVSIAHDEES